MVASKIMFYLLHDGCNSVMVLDPLGQDSLYLGAQGTCYLLCTSQPVVLRMALLQESISGW